MHPRFVRSAPPLMLLYGCLSSCSGVLPQGDQVSNYGRDPDKRVWVRGPWAAIKPSKNLDEVVDQLCPSVMALRGARAGDYGTEYCGVVYSLEDGVYYSSHFSPLAPQELSSRSKSKQCYLPSYVQDLRGKAMIVLDAHGHPWRGSPISREDLRADTQVWPMRIQFDTACRVLKYVPQADAARPGEVYERQGGGWRLIGIVKPEDKPYGILTRVGD